MPEVIVRSGRLAIVTVTLCGSLGLPGNAKGQDYPSRATGRYSSPDQAGAPANYNGPTNYNRDAAAAQAWPDEPPQRSAPASPETGVRQPPNRFPAGGPSRALPVRFEPVANSSSAQSATQASFTEPVVASPSDRLAAKRSSDEPGPALALPSAGRGERSERRPAPMPSMATLLGSLAVVLGLFLLLAWVVRMSLPKGPASLPREAVEVLGRTLLTGRHYVHLVRFGNKMLLVSVTAGSAETLTEITDPVEIDRLAGLCYSVRPQSATANFRQLLQNFGTEPPPAGRRRTRPEEDLDFSGLAAADQYVPSQGASHV
jgi:flagellar biogenesis protein FliO